MLKLKHLQSTGTGEIDFGLFLCEETTYYMSWHFSVQERGTMPSKVRFSLLFTTVSAAAFLCATAAPATADQLISGGTPSLVSGNCVLDAAWTASNGLVADAASADPPASCGFDFTSSSSASRSTLSQADLPTIAGDAYTLSFEIDDVNGSGGEFDISFDGVQIDFFVSGGVLSGRGWQEDFYSTGGTSAFGEVHDLVADPGPTGSVVSFSGYQGSGAWYVDDVSLEGTALPEPSTALMVLSVTLLAVPFSIRRAHNRLKR